MATDWIWTSKDSAGVQPAIGDQLVSIDNAYLRIRNPWTVGSASSGKLYAAGLVVTVSGLTGYLLAVFVEYAVMEYSLILCLLLPVFFFVLMLALSVRFIKTRSDIIFSRFDQRVSYSDRGRVISGTWNAVIAGMLSKPEFTGTGVLVTYSLIMKMPVESVNPEMTAKRPESLFVSTESNEPADPNVLHVAQVWEFIRLFMDEGPNKLPNPAESNWWLAPEHRIYLTPAEAWRHYVPWRNGQPNETQGKSNWLLPLWLVFLPYNMFCALCWYLACRVLNVRAAEPPVPPSSPHMPPPPHTSPAP
ncbi:hypothetical protein [Achromobacter spanius]|uniref:hypothetical protein n=1 Tax=Achromobacter spanius TaxID=217203 RepID=UPI00131A3945|nr:hypothetical protein [Achromobacter spanius]